MLLYFLKDKQCVGGNKQKSIMGKKNMLMVSLHKGVSTDTISI